MTPGKMMKSFATILLVAGLVVGCSKRTPNYEQKDFVDKVKEQEIKVKPDHEQYTASNPKGGEQDDVVDLESATDRDQKIYNNARADIILGKGAGNITFESTIAHGVETLSKPYYIDEEIDKDTLGYLWIYKEGLYIDWGSRDQEALPQRIRLTDEYKGGFEVPGFGKVVMNQTELKQITANPEATDAMLNTIYVTYFDSEYENGNCIKDKLCYLFNENSVWAFIGSKEKNLATSYIFFDDDLNKVNFVMMVTENKQLPKEVENNMSLPIYLTEGAAGINFGMTKKETLENLFEIVKDVDPENGTYTFHENITIDFGVNEKEGNKPQMIRIMDGYLGTFNVPGIGDVQLGQDLSEFITSMDDFYVVMNNLFIQTYDKEANYNCFETNECVWYDDEQTIFLYVNGNNILAAFFLGTDKASLSQILLFTPAPEAAVEAPAEEPTPAPNQGGNGTETPVEDPADNTPAGQAPAYASAPIVLGQSAAGVTWATTLAEASQFLVEIPQTAAYKVYEGGVIVQWMSAEPTSTPAIIYLNADYKGSFNVPGYGDIAIGTPLSSFIPADQGEEGMINFAKAIYIAAIPGTAAGYDCVTEETCYLSQASNGYFELYLGDNIRIDIDPSFTKIAGLLMVSPSLPTEEPAPTDDQAPAQEEEPADDAPVVVAEAPDYAKLPILPGVGVAGLTFDSVEGSVELQQLPVDTGDPTVKLYSGNVVVKWGADAKPEVMLVFGGEGGYEGALTVPGYPAATFGQPLEEIIGVATMDAITAYFAAIYNAANGAEEGYNCFNVEPAACGFSQDESGNLIFVGGQNIYVYMDPAGTTLTQVMMFKPQAN